MRYRAIRNSYGYQGRLWHEGDIIDVGPKDEKPNKHFELIPGQQVEEAVEPAQEQQPEQPAEEQPEPAHTAPKRHSRHK